MLSNTWSSRSFLRAAATCALPISSLFLGAVAQGIPPATNETGTSAYPFDMSEVTLTSGRIMENQDRTLAYIKSIDVDRLLYNFWANHGLSTDGVTPNGGWDAPDFPFRTHMQGHFLNAWAYCYAVSGDTECKDRAVYFAEELAKCQANNGAVGFNEGYVSGFPESDFEDMENGALTSGNVPYYAIHKTLAGLLDVWRNIGDETSRDVMLSLAGWVDYRTSQLSSEQMQSMLGTEFGGMNEVLANIYHQTGDEKWLTAAQRFDHAAIFDPLAYGEDQFDGLHANTQVPKWIGAAREFKATGDERYADIARNAWDFTVNDHTYAIGGNSQAEHFHAPDEIAGWLTEDTAEACNTYNMLKLTRELWTMDPNPDSTTYFDFYERALLNHLLGQQDPASSNGHITYFTSLNPGGHRGVGPAWGGGTWSTDYDSFWCCQGTALETNTKLMDSIYFHDSSDSTLYVNLFTPSVLNWSAKDITVTQSTSFPVSDTTTLNFTSPSSSPADFTLLIRIPDWSGTPEILVNGQPSSTTAEPGTYAELPGPWSPTDSVTITFPMSLRTIVANDDESIAAIAYGPTVLAANYGSDGSAPTETPGMDLSSVTKGEGLAFTGLTTDGQEVELGPFYDSQGFDYVVYWGISGEFSQ
ncbi:hypothetical protein FQN54_006701 [Arachnomyces sp. PD_36]|nr:hypothetical protein FQN54_006701 [Arachnomyces sp. PD_36]